MPKKPSRQAKKMATVMREYHRGTLKSSSGRKVTDPKQAAAIGYSEARRTPKKKVR
jgi:hypothetical protein